MDGPVSSYERRIMKIAQNLFILTEIIIQMINVDFRCGGILCFMLESAILDFKMAPENSLFNSKIASNRLKFSKKVFKHTF